MSETVHAKTYLNSDTSHSVTTTNNQESDDERKVSD